MFRFVFPMAALAVLTSCATDPTNHDPRPRSIGSITPLHVANESIYLAGQPSPEDLRLLREAGVKTIVNLRRANEIDWDEGEVARGLGLDYRHVPVAGKAGMTDEAFAEVTAILADPEAQPVFLHCGSANRVAGMWTAHRLRQGIELDQAIREAETVGLRNRTFIEKAKAFATNEGR